MFGNDTNDTSSPLLNFSKGEGLALGNCCRGMWNPQSFAKYGIAKQMAEEHKRSMKCAIKAMDWYDNSQKQYADHDGLDQPAKSGLISVVALILCGAFFGLLAGWKIYNDKAKRRQEASGSVVANTPL